MHGAPDVLATQLRKFGKGTRSSSLWNYSAACGTGQTVEQVKPVSSSRLGTFPRAAAILRHLGFVGSFQGFQSLGKRLL